MASKAMFDTLHSILEQAEAKGLEPVPPHGLEAPVFQGTGWYKDGTLDEESLSHAASELKTGEEFDFGVWDLGTFRLEVELLRDDIDESGMLKVRWKADCINPDGWWLALLVGDDSADVICEFNLGESKSGSLFLDSKELQFDPMTTSFRYLIFSKN